MPAGEQVLSIAAQEQRASLLSEGSDSRTKSCIPAVGFAKSALPHLMPKEVEMGKLVRNVHRAVTSHSQQRGTAQVLLDSREGETMW